MPDDVLPSPFSLEGLAQRYPLIMRYARDPASMSPFDFDGVACEAGWASLIFPVLDAVETEIGKKKQEGAPEADWPQVEQVKQKFGELRIYVNHVSPAILELIVAAVARSRETCAVCGNPGTRRVLGGWQLATVCDEHAKEKE